MNLDNQPNGAALLLAAAAMTRSLNAADVTHLFSSTEAKLILEEHARNVQLQEQLNIKNQKNQKTKKKNVSKSSYQNNNNSIDAVVAHLASTSDIKKDISFDNSTPLNSNTCSPAGSEPDAISIVKKDSISFSSLSNNLANDENDVLTSNNDTLSIHKSNKWLKRKINDTKKVNEKDKVDSIFEDNIIEKKNNDLDGSNNRVPHHRIKDRRKVTLEIMRKISAEIFQLLKKIT